jgi:biopolymer transport protein ExbD
MSRKPSDHIAPRRLRLPQRGHVRPLFSWKLGRGIFDPSASYYLTFLFAFYAFGLVYLCFFMVLTSFGATSGLPFSLDRYFGSDSVNIIDSDLVLGDSELVRWIEQDRQLADHGGLLIVRIDRYGNLEVNRKIVSAQEFWSMIQGLPEDTVIVIRAEAFATYGDVVRVLDTIETAIEEMGRIRRENVYIWGRSARRW